MLLFELSWWIQKGSKFGFCMDLGLGFSLFRLFLVGTGSKFESLGGFLKGSKFKFKAVQSFVIFGFDSTLVWTHCFNFSSKYEVLNAQGRPDEALRLRG